MKYTLNALCSLECKHYDNFGEIYFIRKTTHRDDIIIVDTATAEIIEKIQSNYALTADIEANNSERIARLVAENILVPLQGLPSKVTTPIAKQITFGCKSLITATSLVTIATSHLCTAIKLYAAICFLSFFSILKKSKV